MPLTIAKSGSIFDYPTTGLKALVNPVNCVGTMGAGLALAFKRRYPDMFKEYVTLCKTGQITVGKVWCWWAVDHFVINFPTKDDWRNSSQLSWISDGLDDLAIHATMMNMQSLLIPALGCGHGDLDFKDVQPLVEQKLSALDLDIVLFAPK